MSIERHLVHVDDDPAFLQLTASYLADAGWMTISTETPNDALDLLIAHGARILLSDIDMPGQTGLELLRAVKAYDGAVQVIMLTGLVSQASVLQSLRYGAEACFFKPLDDFGPLVAALEESRGKIVRWWETLEDLTQRRRAMEQKLANLDV